MSTTTSPDGLFVPTGTDAVAPLHTVMANMQNSVQTAFAKRQKHSYVWASATTMNAQTGMVGGDDGFRTDTNTSYYYNGSTWVVQTLDTGWVTPGLQNSFVTGSATVQYRKLNNRVHFRGDLGRASAPTSRLTAFTLPSGFTPTTILIQPVGVATWNCDVQIGTDGSVGVQSSTVRGGGSIGYTLGTISFLVD